MRTTIARAKWNTASFMVTGVAGVALALAGCDSKEPGEDSVATVDGYEITTAELNQELTEGGVNDVQDPVVRRAALQSIINRKLLSGMAEDSELDRTPDFILKEQRMHDVLLADAAVQSLSPQGSRANDDNVNSFLETNLGQGRERTIYSIEGMQFPRPRSTQVMDRLGAASSFEALRNILAEAKVETQRGNLTWDSASMPTELVSKLNELPDGEPFLIPEGDGVVAGVIRQKRRIPLEPQQARTLAEAAVSQQTVRKRVTDWLEQARHSAEIQYGGGYAPDGSGGSSTATTPATSTRRTADPT